MNRNIQKTVFKVADFISWQRTKALTLSPSFQRRPVWPTTAKSLLIDTVARGIPMPIVFLRDQTNLKTYEPIREVVDGQQRLRTIISFIDPTLLRDYNPDRDSFVVMRQHNKDLAGLTFSELSPETQTQILNYDFSVHILPSDTEDREVLQIFARMNSTGMKLNKQELRNAEFYGAFKRLAYDLAYEQLERWREWRIFSEDNIARMDEVQTTSDFIRLMVDGLQSMSQPALDSLYRRFEDYFPYEEEVTRRFQLVMERISDSVGNIVAATVFRRKSLFETLFALYYDLMFGIDSELEKRRSQPLPGEMANFLRVASRIIQDDELPEDLSKVLRGGTGNRESRFVRLEFLRDQLSRATA